EAVPNMQDASSVGRTSSGTSPSWRREFGRQRGVRIDSAIEMTTAGSPAGGTSSGGRHQTPSTPDRQTAAELRRRSSSQTSPTLRSAESRNGAPCDRNRLQRLSSAGSRSRDQRPPPATPQPERAAASLPAPRPQSTSALSALPACRHPIDEDPEDHRTPARSRRAPSVQLRRFFPVLQQFREPLSGLIVVGLNAQ